MAAEDYDPNLTLDIALASAKLKIVASGAEFIDRPEDLREMTALHESLEIIESDLSDDRRVPPDSYAFVKAEMLSLARTITDLSVAGNRLLDRSQVHPDGLVFKGYRSQPELEDLRRRVGEFRERVSRESDRLQGNWILGLLLREETRGKLVVFWDYLRVIERDAVPDDGRQWLSAAGSHDESGGRPLARLIESLEDWQSELEGHLSAADTQAGQVRHALEAVAHGDYQPARSFLNQAVARRYADPKTGEIRNKVESLDRWIRLIDLAAEPGLRLQRIEEAMNALSIGKLPDGSPLRLDLVGRREAAIEDLRRNRSRNKSTFVLAVFVLALVIWGIWHKLSEHHREIAREAEVARLQANEAAAQARLEAERLLLEAEQRRLAAEAWVSAALGHPIEIECAPEVPLSLVWIPPGDFVLGSSSREIGRGSDEGPQTPVRFETGFWMGRTEITQAQWEAIMGENPSAFAGLDRPVDGVSWSLAMEFCRRLTSLERAAGRLPGNYAYTLPTEAQWEYACRAGSSSPLNDGSPLTSTHGVCANLDRLGWYRENSEGSTQPVGLKQANAWGLFDMHGNVWEWCLDWYQRDYPGRTVVDWSGPTVGEERITRGGSWDSDAEGCRAADRSNWRATIHGNRFGFRIALVRQP